MSRTLRIGARRSPLARAQVDQVVSRLGDLGWACEYVPIITHGDTDRRELTRIGGTGVFTGGVRDALLNGEIDVGVHSLKDLPTAPEPGLRIAAVLERADVRDVLVGLSLEQLLAGSVQRPDGRSVGTGAPRRAVQLLDLGRQRGVRIDVRPVRGNVGTRLDLVRHGELDAVVLAAAGLRRLGLLSGTEPDGVYADGIPAVVLDPELMLSAAGQGAIGCEIGERLDPELAAAVAALDHTPTRAEVTAERTFLGVLEAGCTAPVGARAIVKSVRDTSNDLTLAAVIGKTVGNKLAEPTVSRLSPDTFPETSPEVLRVEGQGSSTEAEELGRQLARQVLA